MKKNTKRLFLLVLAVMLLIGIGSTLALATEPNDVKPSETLEVWLKTSAGTTLLHTYEEAEMRALVTKDSTNIRYSSIDNGGFTVRTIATGVYVENLLNDVQDYVDDLPAICRFACHGL